MQTVLIVDDIADNLYYLEVLLKGNGFEVHKASNGSEAVESARNNPPDLIVSDILMPVMDGYALCREWRADERLRQIPFIFYTATFIEKKDEELALGLGADRFLTKPQEPEALMAIIREVLYNARNGVASASAKPSLDEEQVLKEYSESLYRKLEKKMADLERVNQELQDDISKREQAEKEKADLQGHLIQQDKMATIGQLAAGVAHEINNPIGFIKSNLETLAKYADKLNSYMEIVDKLIERECSSSVRDRLTEERSRLHINLVASDISSLIADCTEGAERIVKIVQDLKVFTHHDILVAKAIDINRCCDTVISIIWNEIKYVATLTKEYGEIPPVICNSQQISQVFMNLLVNAAHSIKEEGKISVRTWVDKGSVFISVSDTGCGIPLEHIPHIFDAFYTTKEVGKGTGLGLSISNGIVRKHDGEITVKSEVGVGSTFTVKLPVDGTAVPAVEE